MSKLPPRKLSKYLCNKLYSIDNVGIKNGIPYVCVRLIVKNKTDFLILRPIIRGLLIQKNKYRTIYTRS